MLSVIRNSNPFHRTRKHPSATSETLSGHVLRDIGVESRQVEEILTYVAQTTSEDRPSHGSDAELSNCSRTPANANQLDLDDESELPDWWFSRMQATVATEVGRLKRCPTD